jgi:hypothetical protein
MRTYFSASLRRTSVASAAIYQAAICLRASQNLVHRIVKPGLQICNTMDSPLRPDAMVGDEARSFSTQQERASDASDIELMPLVPSTASAIPPDGVPERTTELRNDTDTAASPGGFPSHHLPAPDTPAKRFILGPSRRVRWL